MAKLSKRMSDIRSKIEKGRLYAIDEGLGLLKECSTVKFDESVDASINLGVESNSTVSGP